MLQDSGKCIIVSAPSGSGKTTIVRALLAQMPKLEFSISACSRNPRGMEKDGKDYYFIGEEGFKAKIKENAFIEWEEVYQGMFYGTLLSELNRIWSAGKIVIFDVDVEGGIKLKNQMGAKALSIFIQAPSVRELERRLKSRNTETKEKIDMRLSKAKKEMERAGLFDLQVTNDQLDVAIEQIKNAISHFITT